MEERALVTLPPGGGLISDCKQIYIYYTHMHLIYVIHTRTHTHTHILCHILSRHGYHRILNTVPRALQEGLVYPSYTEQFASNPSSVPSPSTSTSVFSVSASLSLFRRRDRLCPTWIPRVSALVRHLPFLCGLLHLAC